MNSTSRRTLRFVILFEYGDHPPLKSSDYDTDRTSTVRERYGFEKNYCAIIKPSEKNSFYNRVRIKQAVGASFYGVTGLGMLYKDKRLMHLDIL